MPRSHARVQVTIWQDKDFRALPVGPQRLYLFLISQSNVTHLGVLPLTGLRWSQAAADYTPQKLRADLRALSDDGFIVVDADSEEVLIRSMFRRDEVWKQPNVLRSAVKSAETIYSQVIRRTLLGEVERVDLGDVPADKVEATQQALAELVEVLSQGLSDPSGGPGRGVAEGVPEGVAEPLTEPLGEGVSEPLLEPLPEGVAEPPPDPFPYPPTRACAYPLLPTPSPTPSPSPAAPHGGFDAWYAAYPLHKGREDAKRAYARALRKVDHEVLINAARLFAADPTRQQAYTPHPATWLNRGQWDDEGPARPQPASRSEQRHQHNLGVVALFAEREQQQRRDLGAS